MRKEQNCYIKSYTINGFINTKCLNDRQNGLIQICHNQINTSQVKKAKSPQMVYVYMLNVKMARKCVEGKKKGDEKVFE